MSRREKASPYFLDYSEMQALLFESTIDFPQDGLDPDIWETSAKGKPTLRPEIKSLILRVVNRNPVIPYLANKAEEIRIVGSICSNLYQEDTDIDVHIVIPDSLRNTLEDVEETQSALKTWSHDNPQYIGEHPIEIYLQSIPEQDFSSEGVYSMTEDLWLKGPAILDEDYNPYEIFGHVMDKVQELAEPADLSLGELKRDVIDYQVIKDAYSKLPEDKKSTLLKFLQDKLKEIDADINELLRNKKEWIEYRRSTPMTTDPTQALKDVEAVKKWNEVNAVFKLLNRYGLIKIISELEDIKPKDDVLQHEDVPKVAATVGVTDE